ncbi:MAG TPA: YcaO-like family protein [Alphaproteobacteria bacterium]|nr:YcaO-like family protein [Alphaproteobacteria bacterium]
MDDLGGTGAAGKRYYRGTHRTVPPAQTIARVQPLLSTFGITRVANLTGLDRSGIPVVMVCRPNARSSAVFHGKGIDIAAAKASGLMEAIETWHAEHVRLPLRFGGFADLRQSLELVDVDRLPRASAGRFHPELPMLWIEGRDLIGERALWLPYECVHMNATVPEPPGSGCFESSTNGLASGNHFLEAASHALCEVIERDATSLWHRRSSLAQDEVRLDLSTVNDELCRGVLDRLEAAGLDVVVWDITTDIGVPAFQCLLIDRTGEIGHLGQGAGCHPTREVALLRALTEAAQVRTTYIVGSREDIERADYLPATLDARTRSAEALMRPVRSKRDFGATGHFVFDDFETEIAWILDRLELGGIREAIVVDLAHPGLDVAVVRAVIPGLEGSDHHAGYVPGPRARAIAEQRR